MWNIKEPILTAANELGIEVSILTYEEKEQIKQSIMSSGILHNKPEYGLLTGLQPFTMFDSLRSGVRVAGET